MAPIDSVPNVHLKLASRADNVLLVRQALRGLADVVALDEVELNDISTAVTEACNNVVSHAYEDAVGELDVEVHSSRRGFEVRVRDRGVGIGSAASQQQLGDVEGGIGLPVMRALTQELEFCEPAGGGTEVRMHFASAKAGALQRPLDAVAHQLVERSPSGAQDMIAIDIGPATLARAVLRRVLTALAARARFSTDRIAEVQQLAEELVAHLADSSEHGHLSAGISAVPRNLELTVGPLRPGSSRDGLAPMLERLTAEHNVVRADSIEVLAVRLVEPARGMSTGLGGPADITL